MQEKALMNAILCRSTRGRLPLSPLLHNVHRRLHLYKSAWPSICIDVIRRPSSRLSAVFLRSSVRVGGTGRGGGEGLVLWHRSDLLGPTFYRTAALGRGISAALWDARPRFPSPLFPLSTCLPLFSSELSCPVAHARGEKMAAAKERMQTRRWHVKNRVNGGGGERQGGVTQHARTAGAFYLLDDSFEAHGECIRKWNAQQRKENGWAREERRQRGRNGWWWRAVSRGVL